MAYDIPPAPHEYVPPPKAPKRTPEDHARIGKIVIGLGALFFIGGFVYAKQDTTTTSTQVFVAMFPLFLIFAAIGGMIGLSATMVSSSGLIRTVSFQPSSVASGLRMMPSQPTRFSNWTS